MWALVSRTCSSILIVCVSVLPARAQETPKSYASITTFSVGLIGVRSETDPNLMTIGMQFTGLRPGRVSGDFAVGTLPRVVLEGFGVLGMRGGLALPLRMSGDSFLIPSAGVSGIIAVGQGEGGGSVGANFGISALLRTRSGTGIRAGITLHRFPDSDEFVWLAELGIGR